MNIGAHFRSFWTCIVNTKTLYNRYNWYLLRSIVLIVFLKRSRALLEFIFIRLTVFWYDNGIFDGGELLLINMKCFDWHHMCGPRGSIVNRFLCITINCVKQNWEENVFWYILPTIPNRSWEFFISRISLSVSHHKFPLKTPFWWYFYFIHTFTL